MPAYIDDERDGRYVLDVFDDGSLSSWSRRVAVDGENVSSALGVGDVVSVPRSATRDPIEARAEETTAERIRREHQQFEDHLISAAEKYEVDLDAPLEDLSDGDVIFLVSPPDHEIMSSFPEGEILYTTPEGFLMDDAWNPLDFDYLARASPSAIESGLFFETFDADEYLIGLRHDGDATERARQEQLEVYFHHASEISDLDNIDIKSDLERPLYVMFSEFDDGTYNTYLFDSANPPSDSSYKNYRRVDSYGSTAQTYLVEKNWPYTSPGEAFLIPVDELTFDDSKDPRQLIANVSLNPQPIVPNQV